MTGAIRQAIVLGGGQHQALNGRARMPAIDGPFDLPKSSPLGQAGFRRPRQHQRIVIEMEGWRVARRE